MDEADLNVLHRGPGCDRDAERERGERSARVERAVDRVDDDAQGRLRIAKGDLPAFLGDGDEVDTRGVSGLELGEDDVLCLAVDHEAVVPALADARVFGALVDCLGAAEQLALRRDHPPACLEPGFGLEAGGQGGRGHPGPC